MASEQVSYEDGSPEGKARADSASTNMGTELESRFADTIGSYEAKTHLPQILKEVEAGREFTVTRNGRAIAKIVPATPVALSRKELLVQLQKVRQGVTLPEGTSIRDLIESGRRY